MAAVGAAPESDVGRNMAAGTLKRTRALQQSVKDFSIFQQRLKGVPLPSHSPLARSEPSDGYCLVLQRCRVRISPGISALQSVRSGSLYVRYTISLYDATTATFFGRTYRSGRLLPLTEISGDTAQIGGDIVYFLSTIKDANAVAVIEPTLVVCDSQTSAVLHEFSLAWTPLAVFAPGRNLTDVSMQKASTEPPLEAPLYAGSPRAMAVAPPGTVYPQQNGCGLTYQLFRHGALRRIRHLVFDSELFGPLDAIPGLALTQVQWGMGHAAGATQANAALLGSTQATAKAAARAGVHASANSRFQRWWSPCMAPSSPAEYLTPQAPTLAPRLRLSLTGLRLYLPPTFETRLSTLLCGAREVEMGLRAGALTPAHVRVEKRALSVSITNGHTVLHRSTVPLGEQFVAADREAELSDTLALLAGSSPRAAKPAADSPAVTPGNYALSGGTLLGAETDVVLHNYTPHEGLAIAISLEYVVVEPTAVGLGIQSRLKLPPPAATELTSASTESGNDGGAEGGTAAAANSSGSGSGAAAGQGQASSAFPGGGLFSGGTTLETRRHVLVACQLYIPCDAPDSTDLLDDAPSGAANGASGTGSGSGSGSGSGASSGGPPGDGPPLRRVFFANRASASDPEYAATYTRRSLEIPLCSPNPGLRLTQGVWLDGGGLEALLQDTGMRHLYSAGNPVLGCDVRVAVDSSKEPQISVMTGPGGGAPSAASKAAKVPPSAMKPPRPEAANGDVQDGEGKKLSFKDGGAGSDGDRDTDEEDEKEKEREKAKAKAEKDKEAAKMKRAEEEAEKAKAGKKGTKDADASVDKSRLRGSSPDSSSAKAKAGTGKKSADPESSGSGSDSEEDRDANRSRKGEKGGKAGSGKPPAAGSPAGRNKRRSAGGYESPDSVGDDDDEDQDHNVTGEMRSTGGKALLRASGVHASAGEDLLAQLMCLPVVSQTGAGTYLPDNTALMIMPGPLMAYGAYGLGQAPPMPTPYGSMAMAPSAGEAGLPFARLSSSAAAYGFPLSPLDRARLVQLRIGAAHGLARSSTPATAVGDALGPPAAAINPASAVALELSDSLSASTMSLTFAAYVPNAVAAPGTGAGAADASMALNSSSAGQGGLDMSLAQAGDAGYAMGGLAGTLGGLGGSVRAAPLVPAAPRTLYFAFQLYSGPYVRTRTASLVKVPAGHPELPPVYVLQQEDGGRAGVTVTVEADPGAFAPSERASFAAYMASCTLCIEVWDGDSLLPVGSVEIGLAHLLRQQAQAIAVAREYDVVSCNGPMSGGGAGAGDSNGYATPILGAPAVLPDTGAVVSAGTVVGRLQVVMTSAGRRGSPRYSDPESLVVRPYGAEGAISGLSMPHTARLAGSLQVTGPAPPKSSKDRAARVKATAKALPASDPGLSALLRMQGMGYPLQDSVQGGTGGVAGGLRDAMADADWESEHALGTAEGILLSQLFSYSEQPVSTRGASGRASRPAAYAGSDSTAVDYRAFLRFVLDGDVNALSGEGRALALVTPADATGSTGPSRPHGPAHVRTPATLAYACMVATTREARAAKAATARNAGVHPTDDTSVFTVADIADEAEGVFEQLERYVSRKGDRLGRLRSRGQPDLASLPEEEDPTLPGAIEAHNGGTKGEAALSASGHLGKGCMTRARLLHTLHTAFGAPLDESQAGGLLEAVYGQGVGTAPATVLMWNTLLQYVLREGQAALPTPDEALAVAASAANAASAGAAGQGSESTSALRPVAAVLRKKLRTALVTNAHVDILGAFRDADTSSHGGLAGSVPWPVFCRVLRDCAGVRIYTGAAGMPVLSDAAGAGTPAAGAKRLLDAATIRQGTATARRLSSMGGGTAALNRSTTFPMDGQDAGESSMWGGGEGGLDDSLSRAVELDVVSAYREGTKEAKVRALLRDSVTTTLHVYPTPGRAVYVEVTVRNPFRHEERFAVRLGDKGKAAPGEPELRLVTDPSEWAYWRATGPPACPDPGLSPLVSTGDVRDRVWGTGPDGEPTVTLLPGEYITLPIVYLSFKPVGQDAEGAGSAFAVTEGHTGEADGAVMHVHGFKAMAGTGAGTGAGMMRDEAGAGGAQHLPHAVLIHFDSLSHSQSTSVVRLEVHPRPGPVHRVVRFMAPENGFLRAALPIPPSPAGHSLTGYAAGDAVGLGLGATASSGIGRYIRVPDADTGSVVVSTVETGPVRELRVRARVGAFPSTTTFRVFLYADPHCTRLVAVWRVVVHAALAFDVHAAVGQSTGVDLVVRGGPQPRRVALYASDPREVLFASGPPVGAGSSSGGLAPSFTLVPRALNRVELAVRPLTPGPRSLVVHMVDVEASPPALMAAWLVTAGASAPAVTRVYDVNLPSGAPSSKRIPYANDWDSPRTFSILTSAPSLVKVREPRITIPAQSKGYLRLAFGGIPGPAREDVYVYVNDEGGRNEETLLLRLQYIPGLAVGAGGGDKGASGSASP